MGQVQLIVDGMTGCGKTTLVNLISEELNLEVMEEKFRDPYDLLKKFSEDPKWCYPMQLNFLITRYVQYLVASETYNYILDRSIYSDIIYARLYREKNYLTCKQFEEYFSLYKKLVESLKAPRYMVLLTCPFEVIMSRIKQRGRADELQLGEGYWKSLYVSYAKHIKNIMQKNLFKYLLIDTEKFNLVNNQKDKDQVVKLIKGVLSTSSSETQQPDFKH